MIFLLLKNVYFKPQHPIDPIIKIYNVYEIHKL